MTSAMPESFHNHISESEQIGIAHVNGDVADLSYAGLALLPQPGERTGRGASLRCRAIEIPPPQPSDDPWFAGAAAREQTPI
jgi:hypothetical protein